MGGGLTAYPHLAQAAIAATVGLDLPRHDPLRYRRMSSPQARTLIEHVVRGVEGYGHAGNAAAKTEELAALFVRMCRGQTRFDARLMGRKGDPSAPAETEPYWIDLPGFRKSGEAWRHWVLVQSYDQGKDSSMRAYRRVLGRWPHKIGWLDKGRGIVKLIKVKPDLEGWSDDPDTWSEITFISTEGMTDEDVKYVQGARIDSAHQDELGPMSVWREVRARRIANEELYLCTTATPEYKHEWEEQFDDFRECYFRVIRNRIRVQWSVRDNRALSLEDIERRVESYLKGDGTPSDLFDARVAGEHVDVTGANPFPKEPLLEMLADARDGRMERIEIRREPEFPWDDDFRDILPAFAEIERWFATQPLHSYLLSADTSRGTDDAGNDPCELELWDWTSEPHVLVARYGMRGGQGGYLDEESLAILADKLGREHGNARIECEVAGNFGVQFIATLRKLRYPNIGHDDRARKPGQIDPSYGWNANATTNGENVNALIEGLNNGRFLCWSRDVLTQLLDVREDRQGRPAKVRKGARHHREAMVCAGRALHVMLSTPAPHVMQARKRVGIEAALRKDFGREIVLPGRAALMGQKRSTSVWRPK